MFVFLCVCGYFCRLKLVYMPATVTDPDALTLEELAIQYGPVALQKPLNKAAFTALAERYPDLHMEREPDGKITIISPVKRGSGKREAKLYGFLFIWFLKIRLGELHGPSTGFDLPDGSTKSPDAAWISEERLQQVPNDEEAFVAIVPDFVGEIRSSSDRLKTLQNKMTDTWMANGVRLAWLIDPYEEKAYIYRAGREVEEVSGFVGKVLSGEDVLPGFALPLEEMRREG